MYAATTESAVLLSSKPAASGQRRFAVAMVAASALVFLALAPFATVQLAPLPVFIPIYQSALVINDIITVVFLLGQRQFARSDALTWLACGYLFTAMMAIAHALSFPGLFAPGGLLGAGPQTTAWLYMFWHSGFPLFVMAYAVRSAAARPPQRLIHAAMCVGLVICLVAGFTLLATWGQDVLPGVMHGNRKTATNQIVVLSVWLLNLAALVVLARRRPHSMLDLWLIVTMCAWLFDIALAAWLNAGRYDLGFYAGRIYGLLAASFILIVLLAQNARLYLELIRLGQSEREKAEELRRLSTIDALTGVANRRAFDDALGLEWRRMLRHRMALSLLLIDVDYFKRFNDRYGHVAGDQCLRAVAQVLAQRARRAGELAARYGGEEFAVLLPHTEIAAARQLAEAMCRAVREARIPHEGSEVAPHVTISVGVASISEVPVDAAGLSRDGPALPAGAAALVEAADRALYAAKSAGRNGVVTINSVARDAASAARAARDVTSAPA